MHKLGISVYPEHSTKEQDYEYLEMAAKYGFSRLFTCLLSVKKPKEEVIAETTNLIAKAHSLGFEVALDTDPSSFAYLEVPPTDLTVFHEMGVDILRLDGSFGELLDRFVVNNRFGIKIEFNASMDPSLAKFIEHGANKNNLTTCHNFYPERFSGLGWNTFKRFTTSIKELGVTTAAFVSSNETNTFGPWPVYRGLPTLEIHRDLPIDVQARHLIASKLIDDILIGNAYASEAELRSLGELDLSKSMIGIQPVEGITSAERQIIFEMNHFGRPDHSDFFIRSSIPKLKFKETSIPQRMIPETHFKRGDVVVVNDQLTHYRGELEVVLQEIENDGERNLVGRIPENEQMILDALENYPDHLFGFVEKE